MEQVSGEYIFFIGPSDALMNAQTLSTIYERMKSNNSNFIANRFIKLRDGVFYIGESQEKVDTITKTDYWFHLIKREELRSLYGKLFGREILGKLNIEAKSDQQFIKYVILNATNPILDRRFENYAYFEREDRDSLEPDRAVISVPKYLGEVSYPENEEIDENINVAICVDDNYCQHISPMLYSIDKNTHEKVDVYLIYYKLKLESLEHIVRLNEVLTNVEIKIRKLKDYQYERLSLFKETKLPTEAYFRLLLPELLPEIKRVLYLDVDMLILNDLKELYQTKLGNNVMGVVRDFPFTNDKHSWAYFLLGDAGERYFNSGMLLLNLEVMRKNNIVEKFIKFISETSQYYFLGDQDAFNVFFFYDVKVLGNENNYIAENQSILEKTNFDVTIMHYCGFSDPKPWKLNESNTSYIIPSIRLYREYQREINKLMVEGPKILIVVEETANFKDTNRAIASIEYQNYGNYEIIFQPLKEGSNIEKLEERYPQLINMQKDNKLRKDTDYLFYLQNGSYFSNWNALSLLVDVAVEKDADYVMPSHIIFKVSNGNFYMRNDNGEIVDIVSTQ
ncbi:glycosyltransferase family 8 protein [Ligilactobacillus salivarius]|uniref:glycosyltransferase family 8 protein n=1 Tax=Ligilactobacillus salivarius TaxID=1624 RepID=UPI0021001986|nr:glycosyltransferase family 8 protein [Ligilactobacillus salivarius]